MLIDLSFDELNGLFPFDMSGSQKWMRDLPIQTVVFLPSRRSNATERNDAVAEDLKKTTVKKIMCHSPETFEWAQLKLSSSPINVCLATPAEWSRGEQIMVRADIGDGQGGVLSLEVVHYNVDLILLLLSALNQFGSSPPLYLSAKCFLEPKILAALRQSKNLKNVSCHYHQIPFSNTLHAQMLENLLDNTNITSSRVFTAIPLRNRALCVLVDSFFCRLSSVIAPSLLCTAFSPSLPVYVVLEIALWETALRMTDESPRFYSAAEHKKRLEEDVDLRKCVEEIQRQREKK